MTLRPEDFEQIIILQQKRRRINVIVIIALVLGSAAVVVAVPLYINHLVTSYFSIQE